METYLLALATGVALGLVVLLTWLTLRRPQQQAPMTTADALWARAARQRRLAEQTEAERQRRARDRVQEAMRNPRMQEMVRKQHEDARRREEERKRESASDDGAGIATAVLLGVAMSGHSATGQVGSLTVAANLSGGGDFGGGGATGAWTAPEPTAPSYSPSSDSGGSSSGGDSGGGTDQ